MPSISAGMRWDCSGDSGMRRWLRVLLIAGLVLVVLVGVVRAMQERRQEQTAQQSANVLDETTVEPRSLRVTISATGAVIPKRQLPLTFQTPGLVSEIMVEEGQAVSAGDTLARLDTSELETAVRNVEIAMELQQIAYNALTSPAREVDVAAAQAALAAAQAQASAASTGATPQQEEIARLQAEMARNQLWQAQLQAGLATNPPSVPLPDVRNFLPPELEVPDEIIERINGRLAALVPQVPGADPQSFQPGLQQAEFGVQIADAQAAAVASRGGDLGALGSANAAIVAAQVTLDRLENGADPLDVQMAQVGLQQAQLAVERARQGLANAVLTAPFDGVIAVNNLRVGELPPQTQPAMLLTDLSEYYVDLAIDETDIVNVEAGQPVELRLDALPDAEIVGRVTNVAVSPTIAGQLVTYRVRVTLDPTDEPVRIGMSATATIVVNEVDETLVLPNRFIRIDRTTQEAYVTIERDPGLFEEIPVVLGARNETESEIISGLQAGQRVVLLPRAAFDVFG